MSLILEHGADLPAQPGSADNFTGTVAVRMVAAGQGEPVSVGRVTFAPGGRTHWHTHDGEQVLYFLEGQGRVQIRGEAPVDAAAGDVVRIPTGAEHWHGAHPAAAQPMTHLAITFGGVTWLAPVTDADYQGR